MKPRLIELIGVVFLAGAANIAVAALPANAELDLVASPDLNGNASAELATLVSAPNTDAGTGIFDVYSHVFIRDSATGARISHFGLREPYWRTLELIAVPHGEGSLIGALQQRVSGAIRVTLHDAATGEFVQNIAFLDTGQTAIAVTFIRDAAGPDVPGLAVLAWNQPIDGRPYSYLAGEEVIIEVRRLDTGAQLQKMYNAYYPVWSYGYDVTPLAIAAVDDQNGNGSSEIAVLARVTNAESEYLAVVTRDADSTEYLSPYSLGNGEATMFFTNTNTPVGFVALSDASGNGQAELAVLGPGDEGYRLQLREVTDGSLVGNRLIYSDWSPRQVRVLGDVDGNGVAEIAVAALRTNGRITVDVRDGAALTLTSRVNFLTAGFDPCDLEVLPDQSGNGVEELALIARNEQTGDVRIQIRDAATGELLRTFWRP